MLAGNIKLKHFVAVAALLLLVPAVLCGAVFGAGWFLGSEDPGGQSVDTAWDTPVPVDVASEPTEARPQQPRLAVAEMVPTRKAPALGVPARPTLARVTESRPTDPNARTGLFTPPGIRRLARRKSCLDRVRSIASPPDGAGGRCRS